MSESTLIGRRIDGSPIYLLRGGSSPEPAPPAPPAAPPAPAPAAPPAPAPVPVPVPQSAPAPGYTPPSQAEWEANQRALQQFSTLAAPPAPGDDDEDDDDSTGGRSSSPVDRSKPPSWDDFERVRKSSLRANREAKRFREQVENQQRELAEAQQRAQAEAQQQQALLAAAEQARREAEALYRPATIKAAAVPALAGAQARADRIDMIYGLIDQSALRVEGDQVHGLAEQIEAVKARVPEWFTPATPPPAAPVPPRHLAPRMTTGDQPPAADQRPQRSADRLAAHILGGNQ
jgi:hypothetical protein